MKYFIVMVLFMINLYAFIEIDIDNEKINGRCQGELIDEMDGIVDYTKVKAKGIMRSKRDIDIYYFAPAYDGKLKIKLNTKKATIFQIGTRCNQRDLFFSFNKTNHEQEIDLKANQTIYLALYDIRANGYEYQFDFEFTPNSNEILDTIAPIITLNGSTTINLTVGDSYIELGAVANDNVDGSINVQIISNNVDTTKAGTYHVVYKATDSSGNSSTKTRKIIVNESTLKPPQNPKTQTINIDNEKINGRCQGELIDEMDGIVDYTKVKAKGIMRSKRDIDIYYFAPAYDGKLKIKLNTKKATIFQIGTRCNQRDLFFSFNKTNHEQEIDLKANQTIYLALYDMRANGYEYQFDFEFIPDGFDPARNVSNNDNLIPPCPNGQFQRVKTKECLNLQNLSWGFKQFNLPPNSTYILQTCSQASLQNLLNQVSSSDGGKVVMPSCTINIQGGITIGDNTILEGAGIGKTILKNLGGASVVKLKGKNIIVRNFTIDKQNLGFREHGIDGFVTQGNVLVEFIEVKNIGYSENSGISFYTKNVLNNSRLTIRYNKVSGGFIGIDVKVSTVANALIYSNEAFNNSQYGIDMSTNANIEVAGNYLYKNSQAGAKSPAADNILYRYNDINQNLKAALVYGHGFDDISNGLHDITIEYNDLSNNSGPAFSPWMGTATEPGIKLDYLILRDNNVNGSVDSYGNNILVEGINKVDIFGNHGKIYGVYNQY